MTGIFFLRSPDSTHAAAYNDNLYARLRGPMAVLRLRRPERGFVSGERLFLYRAYGMAPRTLHVRRGAMCYVRYGP